jgi:signal transduction histidine kinase
MNPGHLPTRFASTQRKSAEEVSRQSWQLAQVRHVHELLDCFPVPAMILNREQQIVAANQKLAGLVGRPTKELLGLRLGEMLNCIHSGEVSGGCGRAIACMVCGAMRATLASLDNDTASVQEGRMTVHSAQGCQSLDLRVSATPLRVFAEEFTVLSLVDITDEKRRIVLERMFFHDVMNAASGVQGLLDVLPDPPAEEGKRMLEMARGLCRDMLEQIHAGRDLRAAERGELKINIRSLEVGPFLSQICSLYRHLDLSSGKKIDHFCTPASASIMVDELLLRRVVGNLIKNALEASATEQTVTVRFDDDERLIFSVHNESVMPEAAKLQVFQRSFSTKARQGRGIGTYSVKLFTERYLKGSVAFRSKDGEGTTFTIALPKVSATPSAKSLIQGAV